MKATTIHKTIYVPILLLPCLWGIDLDGILVTLIAHSILTAEPLNGQSNLKLMVFRLAKKWFQHPHLNRMVGGASFYHGVFFLTGGWNGFKKANDSHNLQFSAGQKVIRIHYATRRLLKHHLPGHSKNTKDLKYITSETGLWTNMDNLISHISACLNLH